MASPQKEDGYTPIANEILDQIIKYKLNGTQFRIVMAVWRYTYGFSRKEHSLSETFLSKIIGVSRRNINREIKPLFDMKILITVKNATFTEAAVISFNKNYEEWQQAANSVTGGELDTSTGGESDTQDKQNIKQNKSKDDFDVFFESVWKLYPHKKGKQAVSTKAKKELCKYNYDLIAKSVENYLSQKPQWQNYMDGSTFFNGRWIEFIETEQQDKAKTEFGEGDIQQWQL